MKKSVKFIAKSIGVSIDSIKEALLELGYEENKGDDYSKSEYSTPVYNENTQHKLKMKLKPNSIYWYCDSCETLMNDQRGFKTITGIWKCKECGYLNDVTENNVQWNDD